MKLMVCVEQFIVKEALYLVISLQHILLERNPKVGCAQRSKRLSLFVSRLILMLFCVPSATSSFKTDFTFVSR